MNVTERPLKRLARARHHLDDLHREIAVFMGREPYPIERLPNVERGGYDFVVHVREPVPDVIGLIFGDYVHNLRAALDNLVYELASARVRSPRDTHWPFCSSRPSFTALPMLRQLAAAHVSTIERYQPYHIKGYEPWRLRYLRTLNTFWNRDKHRTTVPVANAIHYGSMWWFGEVQPVVHFYFGPVHDRKVIAWMPPDQPPIDRNPSLPVGLAFRQHNPVVLDSMLDSFYEVVGDIITTEAWGTDA